MMSLFNQEKRNHVVQKLEVLERDMLLSLTAVVDPKSQDFNTYARCDGLALDANGELSDQQAPIFFKPLSKKIYRNHQINFDRSSTREDDRVLQKGVLKVEGSKSKLDPMNHAENLETLVAHNFGQYPRMATLGNARSLRSLTWWIWRSVSCYICVPGIFY